MSFKATLLAASALLTSVNAHIIMANPVPYSNDKIDNSPISAAQFPCKSQNGFTVTKMNPMAVGAALQVAFSGTAVHGGGSCQLSVTLDNPPTAKSVFKVIKSVEGGCPGLDGATKNVDFKLPASVPNGKATFAWTWFSKMAGQPELYMNCAPIEVTGGASDSSAFMKLPDMLVANIATTTCKQVPNKSIAFPNPGAELVKADSDAAPPTGDCGIKGGDSAPPTTQPSGVPVASAPPAGNYTAAPPAGNYTAAPPAGNYTAAPPAGNYTAAPPAGNYTAAPPAGNYTAASPTSPVKGTTTTLVTVTMPTGGAASPAADAPVVPGTDTTTAPLAGSVPISNVPAEPTPTGASATPIPGTGSGTCTADGAVVCNGDSQFGICNFGKIVWQPVATGTKCSNGVIAKRSLSGRYARE